VLQANILTNFSLTLGRIVNYLARQCHSGVQAQVDLGLAEITFNPTNRKTSAGASTLRANDVIVTLVQLQNAKQLQLVPRKQTRKNGSALQNRANRYNAPDEKNSDYLCKLERQSLQL